MTDTLIKEKMCDICGVDVRAGSMFCYNCGGAVEQAGITTVVDSEDQASPDDNAVEGMDNGKTPRAKAARPPRKRTRSRSLEPQSITWDEPEGVGRGFLLSAAVLILLSLLLIAIAFYLR